MFYDLAFNSWNEEEMKVVLRVLRSGSFTMGENVEQFETQFALKQGSKHAVMLNSGSAANLIAVASLFYKKERPLKAGDEVIVPAVGWATTYAPLQQHGLRLKFLDIDLATLNMDVSKLEQCLTPKTKLVMGVSLLGNPAALDVMKAFCKRHNLYFIEDNCESLGAELKGRKTGTFGDIGTFSTFFSHHICTMEGGMITTDDQELYHLAKSLRSYGWTRNLPPVSPIYTKMEDALLEQNHFILPGYNARPVEINAAVGLEQLKKLDASLEVRRQNACLFTELFQNDPHFVVQAENGKSSWFSFSVIISPDYIVDRNKILKALSDNDIAYRMISGGNFLRHEAIKYFNHECVGQIKNANFVHDRGFMVGNYAQDLTKQLERLHKALTAAVSTSNKVARIPNGTPKAA